MTEPDDKLDVLRNLYAKWLKHDGWTAYEFACLRAKREPTVDWAATFPGALNTDDPDPELIDLITRADPDKLKPLRFNAEPRKTLYRPADLMAFASNLGYESPADLREQMHDGLLDFPVAELPTLAAHIANMLKDIHRLAKNEKRNINLYHLGLDGKQTKLNGRPMLIFTCPELLEIYLPVSGERRTLSATILSRLPNMVGKHANVSFKIGRRPKNKNRLTDAFPKVVSQLKQARRAG